MESLRIPDIHVPDNNVTTLSPQGLSNGSVHTTPLPTPQFGELLTVPRTSTDTVTTLNDLSPEVMVGDDNLPKRARLKGSEDSEGSTPSASGSNINVGKRFTKRASQIILEVPVAHFKRIGKTEGVSSWRRETQHFCDTTTMHGPKRVYYGKKCSTFFWIVMSLFSVIFLVYQITTLANMYLSLPTLSQVSFIIDNEGKTLPMITLCNFNPIKKTYIRELNKTGDFSDYLLDYLMQSNEDVQVLYSNAARAELHLGDADLSHYQETHPNFTIEGFYMDAGFECSEVMKLCTFAGRQFNCCEFMYPVLTNLGKCFTLDTQNSNMQWLKRQSTAGVNAGLQLILDTHLEEQFDGTGDDAEPIFTNAFENGFRYYVHAEHTVPYLASEGISVSPSTRVYSAITTDEYVLLPSEHWGNCTSKWPSNYHTDMLYTSANCASLCKAMYFNKHCGCSPFTYNIDRAFKVCTPYQTTICIDRYIRVSVNGTDFFQMPSCSECKIECKSVVYHAYNSYGHGFSNGALSWLNKKNPHWSVPHIKSNFLTVNVFFRDMGHTEYKQVQATSLTETLSDIGGNMGMFLGMSFITLMELSLYLSKVSWIVISKKRRDYMYAKKQEEEEKQRQLDDTVTQFKLFRSRKRSTGSFRHTRKKIRELRRQISNSFSERKWTTNTITSTDDVKSHVSPRNSLARRERDIEKQRSNFLRNGRNRSLYDLDQNMDDSVIQYKIDVDSLRRNLEGDHNSLQVTAMGRRRASTMPAVADNEGYYLWKMPRTEDTIPEYPEYSE